MKHKVNKLELQIGLKCGERAPPGTSLGSSTSQGSAGCYQVRAVCDSGAEAWCGKGRPWSSGPVRLECC